MSVSPFVESFRIAAPYIHAHRGQTFVVLVGGEAVRTERLASLMHDVALVHGLGVRVVLVHGTRPQIERRIETRGLSSRFVADQRVTDRATLACVHEAVGDARARIESALSMGASNTPMANARIRVIGGNFVTARPIGVRDGVDYLFTGEVRRVDARGIEAGPRGGRDRAGQPPRLLPHGRVLQSRFARARGGRGHRAEGAQARRPHRGARRARRAAAADLPGHARGCG